MTVAIFESRICNSGFRCFFGRDPLVRLLLQFRWRTESLLNAATGGLR